MAFQEVFKIILDSKDFGSKFDEILREWQKFSQIIESKDISFKFNDQSFIDFKNTIEKNSISISKVADNLFKKFKIKLDPNDFLGSITEQTAKAQARLDKNPLVVLEKVKLDLKTLQKNAPLMVERDIGASKTAISKKLEDLQSVLGKRFLSAFGQAGSTNNFAQQLELIEGKILKLGEAASTTAKKRAELLALFTDLAKASGTIGALSKESREAQAKLAFFEKLKGLSPAFIESLETVLKLQQRINAGETVKPKVVEAAGKRFQRFAEFEQKKLSAAEESTKTEAKIVSDGEAAKTRIVEEGGKTRLELVKRVGFKITEANGDTFRPLGEAVTDFSKSAEEALVRSKEFVEQAKAFKVPTTNPLSQENLKKNVTSQELLNKKIEEFIKLQAKIRQLEDETAGLSLKKAAAEGTTFDEAGRLHDSEQELAGLKAKSLNLTAELNTLQKQSLETEKAITAELAKQLRLNAENKKTFTDIAAKQTARVDKIAAFQPQTLDLPDLPQAEKVKDNFRKLQSVHEEALNKEKEVRTAANELALAQGDAARAQEVTSLKKSLNDRLGELRKANTDFASAGRALTNSIAKANEAATKEFGKIRGDAAEDVRRTALASEQARSKVVGQETVVRGLKEKKAAQEVIKLNEDLLFQLESIASRRERDEQAAQDRLVAIDREGTLRRIQAQKLDVAPAVGKSTDQLANLAASFEQQLPKFTQLIQRKSDLEKEANKISVALTEARTAEETKIIEKAHADNLKAQAQNNQDINELKKGLNEAEFKRLEDQTKVAVKIANDGAKEVSKIQKDHAADDQALAKAKELALVETKKRGEKSLSQLEKATTAVKQAEAREAKEIANGESAARIEAAKKVTEAARRFEEERINHLKEIRRREAEIRGAASVVDVRGGQGAFTSSLQQITTSGKAAQTELAKAQKSLTVLSTQGSFFSNIMKGFEKNLGQSIGSVIKFQIAWRITGGIISAATAPLLIIGDTIKRGFEFLTNLQDKAADLREVLVLNVKFSDNLADNFEKAGEAAKFLVLQQEELSGKIGVALDKFQSVFESFAASGGLKAVKETGDSVEESFTKANRSVALIITALNSVGVSTADTRRATENTNKLLEGRVKTADKIRIASGLTAKELNRQSLEAQKTGKFAEFIERIFAAQAERIETSNQRLSTLLTQLRVIQGRIGALFVQPVFDFLIESLQKFIKLLRESEGAFKKFAADAVVVAKQVGDAIFRVGEILSLSVIAPIQLILELLDQWSKMFQDLSRKFFGEDFKDVGLFKALMIGISTISALVATTVESAVIGIKRIINVVKNAKKVLGLDQEAGPEEKKFRETTQLRQFAPTDQEESAFEQGLKEARQKDKARRDRQDDEDIGAFRGLLQSKADLEKKFNDERIVENIKVNRIRSAVNKASSDSERALHERELKEFLENQKEREDGRQKLIAKTEAKILKLQENPAVVNESFDLLPGFTERLQARLAETSKLLDDGKAEVGKKLDDFTQLPRERAGDKTKFNNDRLNELNERVREAFEQITQRTELFVQKQRTLQEARVQSEEETEDNIARILDRQAEDLQRVTQIAIEEQKKFTEADPRAREKFVNTINTRLLDLEGKGEVEREKLRTDAAKRRQKLDDDAFRFEIQRERQNGQARLEQLQEALNREQITRVQFIKAQIEEVRDQTALTKEELEKQLRDDGISVVRRQELQQQLQRAEEEANNRILLLRRQLAAEDEVLLRRRQQLVLEDLTLERSRIQTVVELQEQGIVSDQQRLDNQVRLTEASRNLAAAQLAEAERQLNVLKNIEATTEAIEAQEQAVEALRQAQLRANVDAELARRKASRGIGSKIVKDLTGQDFTTRAGLQQDIQQEITVKLKKLDATVDENEVKKLQEQIRTLALQFQSLSESGLTKFGNAVLNTVNQLQNAINAIIQGFQQGGIGGAVGAGLSQVGSIFAEALGPAGPIVQAAGAVVSVIASAFTAAARRLAQRIKKDFDKTLETFRDESASLGRTISALEAQRIAAIERLSGKKGGKKQLDELLPEFDRAIKDLVKQQKEIQDSFEDELGSLRLGNDALRNFSNAWDDVNKKVQQYVDSFREGEFTLEKQQNAVEFLSRSLEKLQGELLDDLADAEKEAISNALELNDLFKQRADLIKQMAKDQEEFNKAQFELLTADALEARVAGVVQRGNDLVKLRQDFEDKKKQSQEELAILNSQIVLKQRIFDKEKGIFNLTLDRTKLQQRNNELEEQSLDRQIQKWKDIQSIIDGIKRDPVTGNFSLDPALQGQISPRITNVTVGAPQIKIDINTGGAPLTPNQIIDPLNEFFSDKSRFGFNN